MVKSAERHGQCINVWLAWAKKFQRWKQKKKGGKEMETETERMEEMNVSVNVGVSQ